MKLDNKRAIPLSERLSRIESDIARLERLYDLAASSRSALWDAIAELEEKMAYVYSKLD